MRLSATAPIWSAASIRWKSIAIPRGNSTASSRSGTHGLGSTSTSMSRARWASSMSRDLCRNQGARSRRRGNHQPRLLPRWHHRPKAAEAAETMADGVGSSPTRGGLTMRRSRCCAPPACWCRWQRRYRDTWSRMAPRLLNERHYRAWKGDFDATVGGGRLRPDQRRPAHRRLHCDSEFGRAAAQLFTVARVVSEASPLIRRATGPFRWQNCRARRLGFLRRQSRSHEPSA